MGKAWHIKLLLNFSIASDIRSRDEIHWLFQNEGKYLQHRKQNICNIQSTCEVIRKQHKAIEKWIKTINKYLVEEIKQK